MNDMSDPAFCRLLSMSAEAVAGDAAAKRGHLLSNHLVTSAPCRGAERQEKIRYRA
jgi:hypothetical protein